jgi:hypothetical protein
MNVARLNMVRWWRHGERQLRARDGQHGAARGGSRGAPPAPTTTKNAPPPACGDLQPPAAPQTHGTHEWHKAVVDNVRKINQEKG